MNRASLQVKVPHQQSFARKQASKQACCVMSFGRVSGATCHVTPCSGTASVADPARAAILDSAASSHSCMLIRPRDLGSAAPHAIYDFMGPNKIRTRYCMVLASECSKMSTGVIIMRLADWFLERHIRAQRSKTAVWPFSRWTAGFHDWLLVAGCKWPEGGGATLNCYDDNRT